MKLKRNTKKTLIIFGMGLLTAASGFLYLWRDSLTAAPILIVSGYLVMIISLIPFEVSIKNNMEPQINTDEHRDKIKI